MLCLKLTTKFVLFSKNVMLSLGIIWCQNINLHEKIILLSFKITYNWLCGKGQIDISLIWKFGITYGTQGQDDNE